MTDKVKIWEFISGQISEDEEKEVIRDISNSETLKQQYKELLKIWSLTGAEDRFTDEEIEDKLRLIEVNSFIDTKKRDFKYYSLAVLKYAAVFIIAFTLSWFLINEEKETGNGQAKNNDLTFEALQGQIAKAILSDGTIVWLNSNSKLEVHGSFATRDERNVFLRGEAFLEVAKDPQKPFFVHTEQGPVIKVLGTKFDVDAYSDEKVVTTLIEGSIELRDLDKLLVVLKPGEQAVFYSKDRTVRINKNPSKNVSLWKEEVITFKDEKLSSIVLKLEKLYHVNIVVDDEKLNDIRLSGRAFREHSVEEVLDVFKMISNIRYKVYTNDKGEKTIHIY